MTYPDFTPEELESEEWRETTEHLGLFVSNLGRIFSNRTHPRRIVRGSLCDDGYLRLHLREKGQSVHVYAHVLAARAFIPNPLGKPQVNHKDGNKINNRTDNLEWCTALENKTHAKQYGLVATGNRNGKRTHPEKIQYGDNHWTRQKPHLLKRGQSHPGAKLSADQIQYIHQTYQPKIYTALRIANELNVSKGTVLNVLHGKTYTTQERKTG